MRSRIASRGTTAGRFFLKQRHIFEHAQRRNQREVLKHHADTERARVARRRDRTGLAVDADLAGVGSVVAVENFGERAFAGAVFAEQRDHLAAPTLKCATIVGEDGAKPFDDTARFQERRFAIGVAHWFKRGLLDSWAVAYAHFGGMYFA